MVFSSKDVAVVAGLGILAIVILKGGRDLFGALGTIKLPSFSLPDVNIGGINLGSATDGFSEQFDSFKEQFSGLQNQFNLFKQGSIIDPNQEPFHVDPEDASEGLLPQADILNCKCGTEIVQDASGNVTQKCIPCQVAEQQGPTLDPNRPLNLDQFASKSNNIMKPLLNILSPVQSNIDNQQFSGGGPNFQGGVVREIPISELGLGDIVDRFQVTASQAANIKAQASNDFDGFDFGSNTGRGIGSVFSRPDIDTKLNSGNVSNSNFTGLTATQIAERLTGGLINNF